MYKEKFPKKEGRFTIKSYSLNLVGILIFITKIFCYGVLLFAPFIFWHVLKLDDVMREFKQFFFIGAYILMAQDFIRHPSQYILRGEPWNERIFIRRPNYKEEDNDYDYNDYRNWPSQ